MSETVKKFLEFDYSNIDTEHLTAVQEVIKLAREKNLNDFADELEIAFEIKKRPTFDLKNSIFCKYAERYNMKVNKQGVIRTKDKSGEFDYPIIGPMDDVRKFDAIIAQVIKDNSN